MNTMTKITLALAIGSALVSPISGQGTIEFNTRIPGIVEARVYHVDGSSPPGPGWTAQLWGGPANDGSFSPLFPTTEFQSHPAFAHFVEPVIVTVPGFEPGENLFVQMRVFPGDLWAPGLGGESNVIGITLGGGDFPPAQLIGLSGFQIPEPSSLLLAFAGVLAFTGIRRFAWSNRPSP